MLQQVEAFDYVFRLRFRASLISFSILSLPVLVLNLSLWLFLSSHWGALIMALLFQVSEPFPLAIVLSNNYSLLAHRLPKIHLGKTLMHSSSISRTYCARRLHFSSTPCMIRTEMVLILSVDTHSVSVRVPPPQFLMASGLTSLITMHPPNLSSLVRETLGMITFLGRKFLAWVISRSTHLFHLLFSRYVDAVMTIPKGTLFPMCGMNLAFDRELIGPAMYFGLMGDGQPIGRYDDMWAGWCIKVLNSSTLLKRNSPKKYMLFSTTLNLFKF